MKLLCARGPTGIGYTLETLLGLRETNKTGKADFSYLGKPTELKSQRNPTGSMLTLFTKEAVKEYNDKKMVDAYGYYDEKNNRRVLYSTLTTDHFVPQGLKIEKCLLLLRPGEVKARAPLTFRLI